jgi:hypothetical protein
VCGAVFFLENDAIGGNAAEDQAMRTTRLLAISALAAGLAIAPAYGGSAGSEKDTGDRPLSEELDEVFRGLMEKMKPALDELLETLDVLENIDSIEHYERPEIMPNGDIIIRRREDAPPLLLEDGEDAEPGVRT